MACVGTVSNQRYEKYNGISTSLREGGRSFFQAPEGILFPTDLGITDARAAWENPRFFAAHRARLVTQCKSG